MMHTQNIFKAFMPIALAAVMLPACSDNMMEQVADQNKAKVVLNVEPFDCGDETTRTAVNAATKKITWTETDVIGIFPQSGFQQPFTIPASQAGGTTVEFDGGDWALRSGRSYASYYPFSMENFLASDMMTRVPVSYLGQSQDGENCNVGAYDFCYTPWVSATSGSLSFGFKHIGAVMEFNVTLPADGTFTKFTLKANDKVIPVKGTYDLTAENVIFYPNYSSLASSISVDLTNFSGTSGETKKIFMMMPPVDLSAHTVTAELSDGTKAYALSAEVTNGNNSFDILAAKWKKVNCIPTRAYESYTVSEAGTLSSVIPEYKQQTIEALKIVGTLDKSDFATLKTMINDYKLRYLDLSEVVNTDFSCAFSQAYNLKEIIMPTFLSEEYASLQSTFSDCGLTTAPVIPSGVTDMSYTFAGCRSLTTAPVIPSSVTSMERTFMHCSSLTTAPTIPSGVTNMNGTFYGCSSLTTAPAIPSGVRSLNKTFEDCGSLATAPVIPSGVTNMESTFSGCSLATAPVIPSGVTNMSSTFSGCYSLTEAPVIPSSVTDMRYTFFGCESLTAAPVIPSSVTDMRYTFYGCKSLTAAPVIPSSVTNLYYTFSYCISLTTAPEIPSSVTSMERTFSGCTSLTAAPIIPSSVTNLHDTFSECISLTTAPEIPSSVTSMERTFMYCRSLTTAPTIPSGVTNMNSTFYGCSSLTTAPAIPSGVRSLNSTFKECTSLTTIPEIPSNVGLSGTFVGCTSLTKVDLFYSNAMAGNAFYGCTAITDIVLSPVMQIFSLFGKSVPNNITSDSLTYPNLQTISVYWENPSNITFYPPTNSYIPIFDNPVHYKSVKLIIGNPNANPQDYRNHPEFGKFKIIEDLNGNRY